MEIVEPLNLGSKWSLSESVESDLGMKSTNLLKD